MCLVCTYTLSTAFFQTVTPHDINPHDGNDYLILDFLDKACKLRICSYSMYTANLPSFLLYPCILSLSLLLLSNLS